MSDQVFIIAEAGVNHNGDLDTAYELIDVACASGADAVKFQTFKPQHLVVSNLEKADYQKTTTDKFQSQYDMLKALELSHEWHFKLYERCLSNGIEFMSTAFDSESLSFLSNELELKRLKIPSGELTNAPLVLAFAQTGCELLISTGMANLSEVETALGVVAFGLMNLNDEQKPSLELFAEAYESPIGQKQLKDKITLLHCSSEYPAPVDEINLRAMTTLENAFRLKTGYSDHSQGLVVSLSAVALGACVIEKHFTLDQNMDGPDHKASLDPKELNELVKSVRQVELALGDGIKRVQSSELSNRKIVRKSLVARKAIAKGELFTPDNLTQKRPGTGLSPMKYWDLIGNRATRSYEVDEVIN